MIRRLFYTIFLALIILGCDASNPFYDKDKTLLPDYGEVKRDTLYAVADTFMATGRVSTGSSTKLLLGEASGFQTRFLINFNNLISDTINVDSLYLLLSSRSTYGDAGAGIDGTIYLVTSAWGNSVNENEDWSGLNYLNNIDQGILTSTNFTIPAGDTTNLSILLPDTLKKIWQDTTSGDQNFGLLVDYSTADHIVEFNSTESGKSPKLVFVYRDAANDSTIRDTVFASIDASLIDFPQADALQSDSLLYIISGYQINSFFKFELEQIPKNAVLSSANFIFSKDSIASVLNKNRTQNFYLRNITTEYQSLPQFDVDSTFLENVFFNVILDENNDETVQLGLIRQGETGQYFIQSIINESKQNGAFMLQYVGPGTDVSIYAIKGVEAAKKARRPKLIVEYFLIPETRI